jgi:hypothetical protein
MSVVVFIIAAVVALVVLLTAVAWIIPKPPEDPED